ncbi:MAG: hypothetical protein ACLPLR_17200 [Terriglobales bacterium]
MQTHISCRFLQCLLLIMVGSAFLFSQNQPPVSDPRAVTLASQAVAVLTQGTAISDVTLNGTATLTLGSEGQGGTATLRAKGTGEGRVDLNLSDGETRSDARNVANGTAAGAWMKNNAAPVAYAAHNCWTDAPWFFPALSSLAQTANPTFVFKYIGQEQHEGVNTQHIRVFQAPPGTLSLIQHLSTVDFYLDPTTFLPLAIAFQVHPDLNAGADIPAEIRFSDYQVVGGIPVPFRIQRMLNGGLVLDITVTSAAFNTGVPDNIFSL